MSALKYPVGMATFSELIEEGFAYVDKTAFIKPLISQGKFIFLSRPRRFGKSLLLSTLEAYFEGRRELFKGLAADSMDLDWTPSPVLHIDLNTGKYDDPKGLENRLTAHLERYEKRYGITPRNEYDTALRFEYLIDAVHEKTGRKVVILVDEYDKPLLANEDNPELYEKSQRTLKSFFGNLKGMDRYIRFAMITGVARFSKVSIFSDLNNLNDISMTSRYADICGWSEEELLSYFRQGIEDLAEVRDEDFEETLLAMRSYYDGYLFSLKGSRLYNPYSVLTALANQEIDPYWFDSGTPTFLARRIKRRNIFPPDINGQKCMRKDLMAVGLNDRNPIPLMFQTGYLTIGDYNKDTRLYELRFPNREVEIGFYEELLPVYVPEVSDPFSPFDFALFKTDLAEGRPEDFMVRLATLLKKLPYEDHNEAVYRAVTFLIAVLSGSPALAEHHSYKGRSDLEVFAAGYIYIFEFKYNKTLGEAMDQIRNRDYAGHYALDTRHVYLIGANFIEGKEERGLEYEVVKAGE
ncbi:MAG: ATP-binding protein [Muribaculaceae bacterium]|nr:ATP-binding protein [Muribaculaceae bacterium]